MLVVATVRLQSGRNGVSGILPVTIAEWAYKAGAVLKSIGIMRRVWFITSIVLRITLALLLVLPLGLYWVGLSAVEGLPQKPLRLASKEQRAIIWERARGGGVPRINEMNPYSYAVALIVKNDPKTPPDQLVTWSIASNYLLSHQRHKGMGWWHLSGAALTIWLSRNWTSEEILTAAVLLRQSASGRH